MQLPEIVKKYLSKQKISDWQIETYNKKLFNNIIVIPVLDEFENVKILLKSLAKNEKKFFKKTFVVFVINNKKSHNNKIKTNNSKLIDYLKVQGKINSIPQIGIVNASTEDKELPEKDGGVGYARKIGMDLALSYFNYSNTDKKILLSLDADCTVSENYLKAIVTEFNKNNYSAGYANFEHPLPENIEEQKAIVNYEIFLRYYVLGLKYANSPYAFHTVGSTIICDFERYIKVGGMNKRKAGEDFYFMEKLAKITEIKKIKSATVYPSARISDRVPFGTGPRIKRFLSKKQNEYLVYSPKSFEVLKNWLSIFNNQNLLSSGEYLDEAKLIENELYQFLIAQNFKENWEKIISNSKTVKQIETQKKMWMDGFRTLKLLHHLRDKAFPQENMFVALDLLFKKLNYSTKTTSTQLIPPLTIQLKYLELLRENS